MIAVPQDRIEEWIRAATSALGGLEVYQELWEDEVLQIEALVLDEVLEDCLYSRYRVFIKRILAKEIQEARIVLIEIWNYEIDKHSKDDTLDEFEMKYGCISGGISQSCVHKIISLSLSQILRMTTIKYLEVEEGQSLDQALHSSRTALLRKLKSQAINQPTHVLFNFLRFTDIKAHFLESTSDLAFYEVELRYHFTKSLRLSFFYPKDGFKTITFSQIRSMVADQLSFSYLFVKADEDMERNTVIGNDQYNLKWDKPTGWRESTDLHTFSAQYDLAELVDSDMYGAGAQYIDQEKLIVVALELLEWKAFICMYMYKSPFAMLNKFSSMISNSFRIPYQHKVLKYIRELNFKPSKNCILTNLDDSMSKNKIAELEKAMRPKDDLVADVHKKIVDVLPDKFLTVLHMPQKPQLLFVESTYGFNQMAKDMISSVVSRSQYRLKACLFTDASGFERWQVYESNMFDHVALEEGSINLLVFEQYQAPLINND